MRWFGPRGNCGCCGYGECNCDGCIEIIRSSCACSNEDYGVETTIDDLTIDVTGTGYFSWSAGIPSIDVTGTFILACNTKQQYIQTSFWKTESGIHYFSYNILNFGWPNTNWTPPFGPSTAVVAVVETGTFIRTDTTSPYPTRTSVTPIGDPRIHLGGLVLNIAVKYTQYTLAQNLAYFCEHDSTCRAECDPGTTITECPSGTLSGTETNLNQDDVTIVLTV